MPHSCSHCRPSQLAAKTKAMSKRSILVVDDDKITRDYLAAFLTSSGFVAECLESGDEAIERLASGYSPSMILLDIMLPGKDGIEVLANVKTIYPSIPIIILSGIGQIKTVVEAMKMGATDYLTKPFEEEALELAIENAIEKERLKEEVKTLKQQLAYVEQGNILTSNRQMLRIIDIARQDRKSTRLNSSHRCISYAVFCLKKKTNRLIKSLHQV